ncbi:hypothetical protein [Rhodocaloribacter sp.]
MNEPAPHLERGGPSTVKRLLKQWRTTGSLKPRKPGAPSVFVFILSEEQHRMVAQRIEAETDLTDELARRFAAETSRSVSPRTMGRVRARLGLTRKKRP